MKPKLKSSESKFKLILIALKDSEQRREIKGTNTSPSVLDKTVIYATFPCLRGSSMSSLVAMPSTEIVCLTSCATTATCLKILQLPSYAKKLKISCKRSTRLAVSVVKSREHPWTPNKLVATTRKKKAY